MRTLCTKRPAVVRLLVLLVLVSFQSSACASDVDAAGDDVGHGKKLATVNPTAVAAPSPWLTAGSQASGTGGAVSFQGGSAGIGARHAPPPKGKRKESGRHQANDPFAQIQPALKNLKADATSACEVVKDRFEKLTGTRLEQVTAWAARMYKQFMSPPAITPAAGPYVVDRYMHAPLYMTGEGRLKTVVAR